MKLSRVFSALLFASLLATLPTPISPTRIASAAPSERGFQVPLDAVTGDLLDDLINNWKVNVVRMHIGNASRMDGTTGAAYDQMMEERFALLESVLPLFQARNLKLVFSLSSPPGGFETREGTPHSLMYSQASLQDDFVQKWRQIMARFGSHPSISAFDISSEPAMDRTKRCSSCRTWNQLALDTIAAIRETHPTVTLMVQPIYGDPSRLGQLPIINDANIIYSYNSYVYGKYQHTGVDSTPYSIDRPADAAILANIRRRLSGFLAKMYQRAERKQIPASAFPPKIVVGEAAVSACAKESGQFMAGLLEALETDQSLTGQRNRQKALRAWRRERKRNRRAPKPQFTAKDFTLDVNHMGYTVHAFNEAAIWDPRMTCAQDGTLLQSESETDRASVIKSYFSRN
jgi:hypothetical protein